MGALRIWLDGSFPRRVHFYDYPVSDLVEIPRTDDRKHLTTKRVLPECNNNETDENKELINFLNQESSS